MKNSKIHIKINFKLKNQFLIIKYRNKSNNKNYNIRIKLSKVNKIKTQNKNKR
jgi:hypothetical protein